MMVAKAKLKKKTTVVARSVEDVVHELTVLKDRKKDIEKREKELKEQLGTILEGEGVKDSKGSFKLVVGDKLVQKQARKSVKLNREKAEEFFKSIGIWDEVIEVKEEINEDYVEQALLAEKFTMEELEEITDIRVSYAIVINNYKPEEEEMPTVEVN
jgi:hypothetical protein